MGTVDLANALAQWVIDAGISKQETYEDMVWTKTKEVMEEFVQHMEGDDIILYASNCGNEGWDHPSAPHAGPHYVGQKVGDKIVCVLMVAALFFMNGWSSTEKTRLQEDEINESIRQHLRCIIAHMFSEVLNESVCKSTWGTFYAWKTMDNLGKVGGIEGGLINNAKCGRELVGDLKIRELKLNEQVKTWLGQNSKLKEAIRRVQGDAMCRKMWNNDWSLEHILGNRNIEDKERSQIVEIVDGLKKGMKDIFREIGKQAEARIEQKAQEKKAHLATDGKNAEAATTTTVPPATTGSTAQDTSKDPDKDTAAEGSHGDNKKKKEPQSAVQTSPPTTGGLGGAGLGRAETPPDVAPPVLPPPPVEKPGPTTSEGTASGPAAGPAPQPPVAAPPAGADGGQGPATSTGTGPGPGQQPPPAAPPQQHGSATGGHGTQVHPPGTDIDKAGSGLPASSSVTLVSFGTTSDIDSTCGKKPEDSGQGDSKDIGTRNPPDASETISNPPDPSTVPTEQDKQGPIATVRTNNENDPSNNKDGGDPKELKPVDIHVTAPDHGSERTQQPTNAPSPPSPSSTIDQTSASGAGSPAGKDGEAGGTKAVDGGNDDPPPLNPPKPKPNPNPDQSGSSGDDGSASTAAAGSGHDVTTTPAVAATAPGPAVPDGAGGRRETDSSPSSGSAEISNPGSSGTSSTGHTNKENVGAKGPQDDKLPANAPITPSVLPGLTWEDVKPYTPAIIPAVVGIGLIAFFLWKVRIYDNARMPDVQDVYTAEHP
ncbi:hypothetical protein AK88_01256 [Plasmodium fragile]|uniref:Uncharacterized protein n=1 Tax=Plasmodium fragile TaxID=5857 RepID=A0A0D9QQ03_PLAFR|nr:uncharacterized protein AK88_01256 [Plasmodium fragile]KJP89170.1 hypothetical protein AK88_01256 [Plasmodium fragile]